MEVCMRKASLGIDAAFEHGIGRVGKMTLVELLEKI